MRALLCSALLSLAMIAPVQAGDLIDLSVVDRDSGKTLRTYQSDGKLYVAGKPGHRYAVRLSNRTGGRLLAVLSIDGVNAVSGQTADPGQSGYVLDAWESTEINGWRKNLDEVAQFNFTTLPDSYAAQTGRPMNVGVIGVAVFTERLERRHQGQRIDGAPRPIAPDPSIAGNSQSRAGAAAPAVEAESSRAPEPLADRAIAKSQSHRERIGTGHGEREWSQIGNTRFVRASHRPEETVAIWYDSYRNLAARGIVPQRPLASREPQPFPNGFVPDPPRHGR